jgi:NADH-quinone oxidoreductase subunit L
MPLYVWLPDAMAGPTPVSALIHAATMVTAGIYMVCRMYFLYAEAPGASAVIAWTGGITALFAATMAIAQTDIKKVLAYSTVSQLGYMFLAAGCGAYSVAIFHVGTHAFFKALLFLGAGAVILALHHEQDTDKMGGLRKRLRRGRTSCSLIGVLAIIGFPPLSGFFSKDEVLLAWLHPHVPGTHGSGRWASSRRASPPSTCSGCTSGPSSGESRVPHEIVHHGIHEPASTVMVPLYVLAFFSVFAGLAGLAGRLRRHARRAGVQQPRQLPAPWWCSSPHHVSHATELGLAALATAAALGTGLAWFLYVSRPELPARIRAHAGAAPPADREQVLRGRALRRADRAPADRALGPRAVPRHRRRRDRRLRGQRQRPDRAGLRQSDALKYLHGGLAQGYLITMVVGTLAVLAWLLRG